MEHGIVVCAPTGQDAPLAARVFTAAGITSTICRDVEALVGQIVRGAGALLLVEEVISGKAIKPLLDYVAVQPTWSDIPILLLTRSGADSVDVRRAVEHLGNVTLLERPVRTIALISAARSAIRARERQYQVRDTDQRKDEFLATLAHELRNPLAPIGSSMAVLQHLYADSPQVTQVRNVVNRQLAHLTRLVDDLLDVARITSGKVVLKKSDITLHSVVQHAVEISSSVIDSRKHRLRVEQPQAGHVLHADHARLVQSLANLLVNAAKFTPRGGDITLRVAVDGVMVRFAVRDTGVGLEPDSLARIFELFAQTPVPGEAPTGLGIGLSLARQFAEMHGGTLSASSPGLGQGCDFVMALPVVVAAPLALLPAAEIPTAATGTPLKILVVDDNIDAAHSLQMLLSMKGFAVTTAFDGVAALAGVQRERPDVVVMDIGMPGMNGYEAATLMRQQPGGEDITLIALTGWGSAADRQRASQAGFDHHLVKPVDSATLLRCMERPEAV
ncbi:MAG TPA: response regulator [Burkholderiaceae bacterium]